MPTEYLVIILAVAALLTGALYLMTRRRRRRKKSAPPVRPAAPTNQTAGVAATWAPPAQARPAGVAPTMVAPPPASNAWGTAAPSAPPAPALGRACLGIASARVGFTAAGAAGRRSPNLGLAGDWLAACFLAGATVGPRAARVAAGRCARRALVGRAGGPASRVEQPGHPGG
jgi:hypothetical protein